MAAVATVLAGWLLILPRHTPNTLVRWSYYLLQLVLPPHNHTDQEEIYIFTKGRGSMEVYGEEETKSFVRAVGEGDAVTIPLLNYHPVFSQEEELHFIWCIAGNRYWVGDKNKDFMSAKVDKLTT